MSIWECGFSKTFPFLASKRHKTMCNISLVFQIPPEVWCFRCVFGVQIPLHKVFGRLGFVLCFSFSHRCLRYSAVLLKVFLQAAKMPLLSMKSWLVNDAMLFVSWLVMILIFLIFQRVHAHNMYILYIYNLHCRYFNSIKWLTFMVYM